MDDKAQTPADRLERSLREHEERNRAAAELAAHLDLIATLSLDDASDQCIPKKMEQLDDSIRIVSASAGHRHSLLLDANGALYSCGTGYHGCLGHGMNHNNNHHHHHHHTPQLCRYPTRIVALDGIRVRQFSAGVDLSMCVSHGGHVYAWGNADRGRLGLPTTTKHVPLPQQVPVTTKMVDVECGYAHSLLIGIDGTLHVCGGVGVDGAEDGQPQQQQHDASADDDDTATNVAHHELPGQPRMVPNLNIWHRWPDANDDNDDNDGSNKPPKKERWKKYGKYEVKGRSKNL